MKEYKIILSRMDSVSKGNLYVIIVYVISVWLDIIVWINLSRFTYMEKITWLIIL